MHHTAIVAIKNNVAGPSYIDAARFKRQRLSTGKHPPPRHAPHITRLTACIVTGHALPVVPARISVHPSAAVTPRVAVRGAVHVSQRRRLDCARVDDAKRLPNKGTRVEAVVVEVVVDDRVRNVARERVVGDVDVVAGPTYTTPGIAKRVNSPYSCTRLCNSVRPRTIHSQFGSTGWMVSFPTADCSIGQLFCAIKHMYDGASDVPGRLCTVYTSGGQARQRDTST